jgi:4-hydroxymandelate oxidase
MPQNSTQQGGGEAPGRIAPVEELVNSLEFEGMARRTLDSLSFALVAGGDRRAFERITFRPRLMVNTTGLDLSLELFGRKHFAPILVGPVAEAGRFHTEGEAALARGAAAGKALIVLPEKSSAPTGKSAAEAQSGWWFQASPATPADAVRAAVVAGCGAVCLTPGPAGTSWSAVEALAKTARVPVVLKGVMSPEEAVAATQHGVSGLIVSNYAEGLSGALAASIEVLPAIAQAVAGKIPLLLDGGVRRGSDVLKALALGASAVLIARPAVWGLAAYGAAGVQRVVEVLQTDLARDMAMCGRPTLKSIDASIVRINKW